ncbi:sulfuric ester hydrolase [Aureococcus anophagefferens]|nr:sulfuric ester hydrolase [Aureococcus anophagefferens]
MARGLARWAGAAAVATIFAAAGLAVVLTNGRASAPLAMSAVEAPRVEEKAARVSVTANEGGAPDIVHIVLDDIGMNDLWHSSDLPASVMTNIKALQEGGVELSNYYGQSFCAPALMSGKFIHRTGFAGADVHGAVTYEITAWSNFSLARSTEHVFMSETLKAAGYENHGVGKWNLGHCNSALLPTSRGFDSWLGYFGAGIGYTSHLVEATSQAPNVFSYGGVKYMLRDMVRCDATSGVCKAATDEAGVYSTTLITRESVARVKGMANTSSPTYVYASYHGVHDDYGVNDTQSEVPPAVMLAINEATTMVRRKNFAVGMYFVDEGVGALARALATHSTDYVIVLHADNGGSPCGSHCDSNNHPYRGTKFYDFEGAVKLPSLVYSPRLAARAGTSYNGLMHHVDWLATFATGLAGVAITDDTVDSLDHWKAIHAGNYSDYAVRDTVAFSLGATEATLRFQQYKYMKARSNSSWYDVDREIVNEIFLCMNSGEDYFLFDRTNPVAEPMDAATKAAFIDSTPAKEQVKYVLPWGCDLS